MKLKNKKTGEIVEKWPDDFVVNSGSQIYSYNSLAGLCEEWEDVPDGIYYSLSTNGNIHSFRWTNSAGDRIRDELGNKFSTEDEAREAVKKLCAWKRLKDNGFRFNTKWTSNTPDGCWYDVHCHARITPAPKDTEFFKDLDLLFSGGWRMELSTINQIVEWMLNCGDAQSEHLSDSVPELKERTKDMWKNIANEATIYLKTAMICESDGIDKAMEYFTGTHTEDEYQEFRTGVIAGGEECV